MIQIDSILFDLSKMAELGAWNILCSLMAMEEKVYKTTINTSLLKDLAQTDSRECVSIYTTLKTDPSSKKKLVLKIKSLIDRTLHYCEKNKSRYKSVFAVLQDLRSEVESMADRHIADPSNGFALLVSERGFYQFSIGDTFAERTSVGSRFFLLPLLELNQQNQDFYFLKLHPFSVEFYRADQFSSESLGVESLPKKGLDDMPYFHKTNIKAKQHHSVAEGSSLRSEYHGQSDPEDLKKSTQERFAADVAQILESDFRTQKRDLGTLYVSCSDTLFSAFKSHWNLCSLRQVENYTSTDQRYDEQKSKALLREVRQMDQDTAEDHTDFLERSKVWKEAKDTSRETKDILRNADYQNIDKLWIRERVLTETGESQYMNNDVEELDRLLEMSQLNQAAMKSLLQGAEIHFVDEAQWPLSAPAVAECRSKVL